MHTLVIGAGFSGYAIAQHVRQYGSVCGTRQQTQSLMALRKAQLEAIVFSPSNNASSSANRSGVCTIAEQQTVMDEPIQSQLAKVTHLVICVAPARQAPLDDAVLRYFSSAQINMPKLEWVGYLSTIGVYGNHDGAWIDESTPCGSTQVRSLMRLEAENAWHTLCEHWQIPLSILRLSGIYGAGRNAIEDAVKGRARMLIKPEQVFNRIHVGDLAKAVGLCAQKKFNGIVNITDDLPAPPQDVICYAHRLAGKSPPPAVDFKTADISDMARSFYSENKRVSNALSKQQIDMHYTYPTYIDGLDALWSEYVAAESDD